MRLWAFRESIKFYMILGIDAMRKKLIDQARIFVKQKRIKQVNDIFDLTVEEIFKAINNQQRDINSARQKNILESNVRIGVKYFPRFFDSRWRIFTPKLKQPSKNQYLGTPISPWVVRWKVRILHAVDEKVLEPGEILLTRATDPGWTPLFVNAWGIILEVWGSLQHGALVAREYWKPCIVWMDGLMQKLEDGQEIEMDGSTGMIKVL